MLIKKQGVIFLLFLASISMLNAQESTRPANYDYFSTDDILHISLGFDLKEFIKTKINPENLEALMTIYDKSDTLMEFVKVKARGNMRRKYCTFPPLTIKFKNSPDIKVVTHCRSSEIHTNYLFREYLVYKMYNRLTAFSFKTRLVKIDYVDTRKNGHVISEYAFFIEDDDRMAERNLAMVLDNDNISQSHMRNTEMARVAIFNYMIGNTDWSVLTQHNIKILRPVNEFTDEGIPVTYDFDYSGFVSTAYSAPAKDLPIKSVSERYYLGNCMPNENLEPVIEEFEALKPVFLETINDFDYLPVNSKKKLDYYINSFYKEFRNQNILISELNRTCRRP